MAKYIIIALFLLASCATQKHTIQSSLSSADVQYIITENMKSAHQCDKNLPVFYMIGENVPADLYSIIIESFNYWGSLTNKKLFMQIEYIKEVYDSEGGVTPIGLGEMQSFVGGKTIVRYNDTDGCIFKTKITLNLDIQYLPIAMQHNIIRHEIGHLLGLDDSNNEKGIMNRSVHYHEKIKELIPIEVIAFRLFYL